MAHLEYHSLAKGRTNMELREKFILPEGTTQVMASFRYRGRRSRPSSRGASPNRSTSSQSCAVPSNLAATTTVKVRGSTLLLLFSSVSHCRLIIPHNDFPPCICLSLFILHYLITFCFFLFFFYM